MTRFFLRSSSFVGIFALLLFFGLLPTPTHAADSFKCQCLNPQNSQTIAEFTCTEAGGCASCTEPANDCAQSGGKLTTEFVPANTGNGSNFNDTAYRNAPASVFIPANCAGDQRNNECSVCDIFQLLINVSKVILALTGVAAVLMFILAGFLFITAYGDTARINQGKEIVKAVIVGVFVIMTAWTLINTVIISLTNGKFTITSLISGNLHCESTTTTTKTN